MSLLPPNATPLEQVIEQTMATSMDRLDVPIDTLWQPKTCPVAALPWLAWALSVDQWDEPWLESTQREVIQSSIAVHRNKGTLAAVQQILTATGYGHAVIIEGPDDDYPTAHWATYRVQMVQPITIAQGQRIRQLLGHVAPARCQLTQIVFEQCHLYDGIIGYDGQHTYGTHGPGSA